MIGLVLFAAVLIQGGDTPQPDRWHGLILGETRPEQAVQLLGNPKSDKPDRLFIREIGKWFEPGLSRKNLRKQTFREVAGFDRVDLYYKDGNLVVIQLDPSRDQIQPSALQNIYGVEFRPFVDAFTESSFPGDFERHEGRVFPRMYPLVYSVVAISPKAIIAGRILNGGVGRSLRTLAVAVDAPGSGFPGKVQYIQLISRQLENRQGANLLK